ncbi:hypothetical protein C3R74_06370 [Acidithiobacillus ferridurans]|jgi:hypothetical protein|nr:hypothetical protein C3R74_06370 [Acidithiobacillus ferridurans]
MAGYFVDRIWSKWCIFNDPGAGRSDMIIVPTWSFASRIGHTAIWYDFEAADAICFHAIRRVI